MLDSLLNSVVIILQLIALCLQNYDSLDFQNNKMKINHRFTSIQPYSHLVTFQIFHLLKYLKCRSQF